MLNAISEGMIIRRKMFPTAIVKSQNILNGDSGEITGILLNAFRMLEYLSQMPYSLRKTMRIQRDKKDFERIV